MACNEFVLGQFQCPSACPVWVPNPVWKCVGACITPNDDCHLYNPLLHFNDAKSNRCLPCTIPGCISCQTSNNFMFNLLDWNRKSSFLESSTDTNSKHDYENGLTDINMNCYECAKGYILSDDNKKCIYRPYSIWSKTRTFFKLIAILSSLLLIAIIFNLINPNTKLLKAAIKNSKMLKFYKHKKLYPLETNLKKKNVAGIGILYYFKRLHLSTIFVAILALSSLYKDGLPYSKLLRSSNVTVTLDANGKHIFSGESLFETHETCAKLLSSDIKGLDPAKEDAFSNNYMNKYYYISIACYISVIFFTIISAFPDINEYTSNNSLKTDSNASVILVDDLTENLDTEGKIEDYYETLTGVRPVAVICYDYKGYYNRVVDLVTEQNEFLEGYTEHTKIESLLPNCLTNINKKTTIVQMLKGDLGGSLEEYEIINAVKPTGKAYLQFKITNKNVLMLVDKYEKVKLLDDIDWNSFSNTRIPFNNPAIFVILCLIIICIWLFLFYTPYALYSLSNLNLWEKRRDSFSAALCTTLFISVGQMFVSNAIGYLIQFLGIHSKSRRDSFKFFTMYSFQLINLLLNSMVTHINRYGGQMKLFSLFKNHKKNKGFARHLVVSEEISLANSISTYILPTLIIIPSVLEPIYNYLVPFCIKSIYILSTSNINTRQASNLIKPPKVSLVNAYCNLMVNLTSAIFLQFLIHDTWESFFSLIALSLLFAFLSYLDTYLLLRHSLKAVYNSSAIENMALKIWAFPSGLLAACPGYWLWRMGHVGCWLMILSFLLHFGLYLSFILYLKPHLNLKVPFKKVHLDSYTGTLPYSTSPMHVLKSFSMLYSSNLLNMASGNLESELLSLSRLDVTPQLNYCQDASTNQCDQDTD